MVVTDTLNDGAVYKGLVSMGVCYQIDCTKKMRMFPGT